MKIELSDTPNSAMPVSRSQSTLKYPMVGLMSTSHTIDATATEVVQHGHVLGELHRVVHEEQERADRDRFVGRVKILAGLIVGLVGLKHLLQRRLLWLAALSRFASGGRDGIS